MKGKQIVALVVAVVLFVFTGGVNLLMQVEAEKQLAITDAKTEDAMSSLFGMGMNGEMDYSTTLPMEDFVGVIEVTGTIQDMGSGYVALEGGYDHQGTLAYIDALMESESNQAILLYEETPGGTIIDSDELYLKLMEYKEVTGRPVYAYMHSYAYSGGYYIAMAADKIFVNRNATTGSIGVIMSTYDLTGLYEKLGVKEINITSGENKAMFTGDDAQTQKQIEIYQDIVDDGYNQFIDIVKKGRDMTDEQIKPYADGSVFSANKAKELGLVDEVVPTYEDALDMIVTDMGIENDIAFSYMPAQEYTFWDQLFMKAQSLVSKSDNQVLQEMTNMDGKGLMYYAEP